MPRRSLVPTLLAATLCAASPARAQSAQPTTDATRSVEQPAAAAAQPVTDATRPAEQTPSRRQTRLTAARRACRDSRTIDAFGVAAVPVLAVAGITLSVIGFTTPETPSSPRGPTTFFLNAFGPGLVLGAVGVPLGRGWLGGVDPLHTACDTVLDHEAPSDEDVAGVETMLRAYGGPASLVMPVLMASATVAVGGGLAAAFAIPNRDLAQAMGGIAAAVVAGWALVPATPNVRAARGFTAGRYGLASANVAFTGQGLSVAGTF